MSLVVVGHCRDGCGRWFAGHIVLALLSVVVVMMMMMMMMLVVQTHFNLFAFILHAQMAF